MRFPVTAGIAGVSANRASGPLRSGRRTYGPPSSSPRLTGNPRPVVIIQDDRLDATDSVTVCPLTTGTIDAPLVRIPVEPGGAAGIHRPSQIMVDKVTTLPRTDLHDHLGRLAHTDSVRLALLVLLGLAA